MNILCVSETESTEPEFSDLTEKQQDVVDELCKEDDPFDPDRTNTEIAEEVGVHDSYIPKVINNRQQIVENRKQELESTDSVDTESVEDVETNDVEEHTEPDDSNESSTNEETEVESTHISTRETVSIDKADFDLFVAQMSTLKRDALNATEVTDDCNNYPEGKLYIIREIEGLFDITFDTGE